MPGPSRRFTAGRVVLIVNSFFTYAGIEVNAVHVDELRNPGREYPKSIFLAMALVLAVFIGPTLAIAWVIPAGQISFTTGVMQAFDSLLDHFGVGFAVPLIAIALAVGALAGMISWLDGPSEGLLRIGREQGFLPPYFQRVNGQGIEVRILAAQGTVITLIAAAVGPVPQAGLEGSQHVRSPAVARIDSRSVRSPTLVRWPFTSFPEPTRAASPCAPSSWTASGPPGCSTRCAA